MKTLESLAEKLNDITDEYDNKYGFYIRKDYPIAELRDESNKNVYFLLSAKGSYTFTQDLAGGQLPFKYIKPIVEYLANTSVDDWFPEKKKKYNIVIGKYYDTNGNETETMTAYKKGYKDCIQIFDHVPEECLSDNQYQFTEEEINNLKARLPENMAKIVDFGKVEVKDA